MFTHRCFEGLLRTNSRGQDALASDSDLESTVSLRVWASSPYRPESSQAGSKWVTHLTTSAWGSQSLNGAGAVCPFLLWVGVSLGPLSRSSH